MRGRHRPPRTKRELKARNRALAEDLARSEESRVSLLKGRHELLDQIRDLSARLVRLQRELGTEDQTVPVHLVRTDRPVALLKPPAAARIPVQAPDGTQWSVQVGKAQDRPSQGHTAKRQPRWASG